MNKKTISQIMLITCLTVLFYVVIQNFSVVWQGVKFCISVISPFLIGCSIAFIVNLPMSFIEEKLFSKKALRKHKWLKKIKRPVSLILGWLFILAVFTVLLMLIIPELQDTIEKFTKLLPFYMRTFENNITNWLAFLNLDLEILKDFDWESISLKLVDYIQNTGTALVGKTVDITAEVVTSFFNIILGFVFSIYILLSKEKLSVQLKKLYASLVSPKAYDNTMVVLTLTNETFSKFIAGQCTEALILGVLCYIGMTIFRMPFALMISSLIAITALVPIFGAFIGTGIGAFMILIINPIKALWFIVFILVLQQLESNLIYPKVVGKSVGLDGIWVLLAVTLGGKFFGAVGLLVAVPIFSVAYCLIRAFVHTKLDEKKPKPSKPKTE